MAKQNELSALSYEELVAELAETKKELFNLRFKLATGQQENHALIPATKRQVARINTALRALEIERAEQLAAEGSK
jgi:large subunit ribosomal protein L29